MDANTPQGTTDLARLLSLYRELRGASQHDVAAELSEIADKPISQAAVSRWENGGLVDGAWRRSALCELLGVPPDDAEALGRGGTVPTPEWAAGSKTIDLTPAMSEQMDALETSSRVERLLMDEIQAHVEGTNLATKIAHSLDMDTATTTRGLGDLQIYDRDGNLKAVVEIKGYRAGREFVDAAESAVSKVRVRTPDDADVILWVVGGDPDAVGEMVESDQALWRHIKVVLDGQQFQRVLEEHADS